MTRNECIARLALRSIECNLTGKDYFSSRVADSLRRATEALEQLDLPADSRSYLCDCGWGCHDDNYNRADDLPVKIETRP